MQYLKPGPRLEGCVFNSRQGHELCVLSYFVSEKYKNSLIFMVQIQKCRALNKFKIYLCVSSMQWGCSSVVERMLCMYEAPSSILGISSYFPYLPPRELFD